MCAGSERSGLKVCRLGLGFSRDSSLSQTTRDGHMTPSQDCLGTLLDCMRSAWEGPEDAVSCACRFLACVAGAEQEEHVRRVLSFLEAVRGGLVEGVEGCEASSGGEGSVEEAGRKRARRDSRRDDKEGPGEAEAGAKAPSLSGQAGTAAAAAPEEAACVAAQEGMSRAVKGVLLDGDLLGCVWGFVLGGSGPQDTRVLGHLSLVCGKWREASLWDAWWGRVAQDMLPVLWEEEKEEKAASSRGRVVRYGRFLEGQREHLQFQREDRDEGWLEGLEGHVEVFDRMDGFQMLSMRGPVALEEGERESVVLMQFRGGSTQMQRSSAAFSAASRDPLGRFGSLREYLTRGYREEYPCCLCIRVTLRDMRTGKMAVVLEDNKGRAHHYPGVGGDRYSFTDGRRGPNAIGRLSGQSFAHFYVRPVVGQGEAVSMQDRLYHVEPSDYLLVFHLARYDRLTLEQLKWALQAVMT